MFEGHEEVEGDGGEDGEVNDNDDSTESDNESLRGDQSRLGQDGK